MLYYFGQQMSRVNDTDILSITYSSGCVPGRNVLSTLAVFYDEISLPYPYGYDPDGIYLWRKTRPENSRALTDMQSAYLRWRENWSELFEHNIFQTLPPPISSSKEASGFGETIKTNLGYSKEMEGHFYTSDIISGKVALLVHALYGDKPTPELFVANPQDRGTSRLAGFVVRSLFNYQVPQIGDLNAEQILEVRDLLKDTKEGFVSAIFEAVDDVEDRINNGDASETKAAQKTVERKLTPQYKEIRRQLESSRKTSWWSSVLATGGRLLQIDVAPWTPKFYGQVIEAFFETKRESEEARNLMRSNSGQAFQYLTNLRSYVENK